MATVLITGGHSGLGFEVARKIASTSRANLLLAGRNRERVNAAAERLRAEYGVRVDTVQLDLASLASVRAAAGEYLGMLAEGRIEPLQSIVCNAGVQFHGPVSYSADGYEETFAVNCLGHFLLVNLLLGSVADGGRVVFVASGTHDPETMDGRMVGAAAEPDARALALQGKDGRKAISGGRRYSTSKLGAILYAYEMDRRLRAAGVPVASIAFDPGLISDTELARTAPGIVVRLLRTGVMQRVLAKLGVTMGSLAFSGEALARVAAGPEFASASGKYIQSRNGTLIEARSSRVSYDTVRASSFWSESERLVHLRESEKKMPHR